MTRNRSVLRDSAAVNDHDLAIHKTIPLTHHERSILGEFLRATETSG